MTVAQTEIETATVSPTPLAPTQRFGVAGRADAGRSYKGNLLFPAHFVKRRKV